MRTFISISDPCTSGASCVNNNGGFECLCASGTSGHLCQYTDQCQTPNICSEGKEFTCKCTCIKVCTPIPSNKSMAVHTTDTCAWQFIHVYGSDGQHTSSDHTTLPCFALHTSDSVCVSTLLDNGFLCRATPTLSVSVVISSVEIDVGFLNDLIQGFIETLLVSTQPIT